MHRVLSTSVFRAARLSLARTPLSPVRCGNSVVSSVRVCSLLPVAIRSFSTAVVTSSEVHLDNSSSEGSNESVRTKVTELLATNTRENIGAALKLLQSAFETENERFVTKENAQLFHLTGMAYEKMLGDLDNAAECYATAVHIAMGCPALTGAPEMIPSHLSQAVADADDTLELAEARFNLGRVFVLQGRLEDAVQLLDTVLASQKKLSASEQEMYQTRRYLAHALRMIGQLDLAKAILEGGIGESVDRVKQGQLLVDLSAVWLDASHFTMALSKLSQGVEMMGKTPTMALLYMAQANAGLKNEDRADALFKESIRRATADFAGNPFNRNMAIFYEKYYRFLKRRLGKMYKDEAKRMKLNIQQCEKGTEPMKMNLEDQ
eukprot:ANDGO_03273.mRNA.1 hypothetical protein